jgi:DNA-binding transcriptional MerR regulator
MEGSWTIQELARLAAEALAAGPAGPGTAAGAAGPGTAAAAAAGAAGAGPDAIPARPDGRVRDVPNERLIRWYATVGLVDPPLSRRGRVARYGRRHLLQLVAVKRRQAEGRSLAEIQAELAGATDEALAAAARVPGGEPAPQAPSAAPARFWARQPRHPGPPALAAVSLSRQDAARPALAGTAAIVHGVRLAPGVLLLLEGAEREPGPDDLAEVARAARPLLSELAGRGLCAGGRDHPAGAQGRPPGPEPDERSRT